MAFAKEENKKLDPEEEKKIIDKLGLLQTIAYEKCRMFKVPNGIRTNQDKFLWSEEEARKASRDVVNQAEELMKLKYGM